MSMANRNHLNLHKEAADPITNHDDFGDYNQGLDVVDQGISRQKPPLTNFDTVDLGFTRKPGSVYRPEKADLIDCFIAVISICTYLGDIGTDILAAYNYFNQSQWSWFAPTIILIILPSFVLQLFSSRWYHDDEQGQSTLSYILHFLQLSTIERYMKAFWYGTKTLISSKPKQEDFSRYLEGWRDVTLLRLFECFLESAPQVVLQLYILSTFGRRITLFQDWVIISAISLSIGSIGWAMVSYSHALRLCNKRKGFSICGYTFQVIYRLSMISSRVAALTLFTTEFGWIVVPVVFIHWLAMVIWLSYEGSEFCAHSNRCFQITLERIFAIVMGVVYVFCFINVKEGTTRARVMAYYIIFFIENSLLIAFWYPTRSQIGILEIGAIVFTWGGFLIGLFSMLAYYKFFHPKQDITEGWCNCCCRKEGQNYECNTSSHDSEEQATPKINPGDERSVHSERKTPHMRRSLSVDVELSTPSPKRRRAKIDSPSTNAKQNGSYGATEESPARLKKGNDVLMLVPAQNGGHIVSYTVDVKRSVSFDHSGKIRNNKQNGLFDVDD
eukprot:TCONS_00032294-protein